MSGGYTQHADHRSTAERTGSRHRPWYNPSLDPTASTPEGELLTIKKAAVLLAVAPSTIHRLLNDGIIAGEQLTPGAPWRIRLTDELKARFNGEAADGFLPLPEAMPALTLPLQTTFPPVLPAPLDTVPLSPANPIHHL